MFAHKSRILGSAILVAALAFPMTVDAHAGAGSGHGGGGSGGGMGHGGMGHGHGWHHGWGGWGGWSWGVPWGWSGWDYPVAWDGGNSAAYQQGYYTALQQAQWAAQQQQQAAINQRLAQHQAPEHAVKPVPKRQPIVQNARPTPPVVVTPEERAAGKLKLAMALADAGKTADAAEFSADIVKKYPETPAAKQAQAFLDKIGNATAGK